MTPLKQVRAVVETFDRPFLAREIIERLPNIERRIVSAALHHAADPDGWLTKRLIPNPDSGGHGNVCEFTRVPGWRPRVMRGGKAVVPDIGNPEAALRLQHALSQMGRARA